MMLLILSCNEEVRNAVDLKPVSINEKEQIFLDGKLLDNVESYRLEHSAGSEEPAKLTVTMYVRVSQAG